MASEANAPTTAAIRDDDNTMPQPPVPAMIRPTAVDYEDGSAIEMETLPATDQPVSLAHRKDGSAPESESLPATNEQNPPAHKKDDNEDNKDLVDE